MKKVQDPSSKILTDLKTSKRLAAITMLLYVVLFVIMAACVLRGK